jgi:hypothetical protein
MFGVSVKSSILHALALLETGAPAFPGGSGPRQMNIIAIEHGNPGRRTLRRKADIYSKKPHRVTPRSPAKRSLVNYTGLTA